MAIKIPEFTTTCVYETELDNGTWYIRLKSSGTFAFRYSKTSVDVFLQGGGGGGGAFTYINEFNWGHGGGGGAGGYQQTQYAMAINSEPFDIAIGAGGGEETAGGATSAFGLTAAGGSSGKGQTAGKAGTAAGGAGGSYLGNGIGTNGGAGKQGKQAFGVGDIYYGAGGGGEGGTFAENGTGGKTGGGNGAGNAKANTGSGGGGSGRGGSGIVILRGTQDDQLPVKFDGVTLQRILYNGQDVMHLIHDGTKIFMERINEWLKPKKRFVLQEV